MNALDAVWSRLAAPPPIDEDDRTDESMAGKLWVEYSVNQTASHAPALQLGLKEILHFLPRSSVLR